MNEINYMFIIFGILAALCFLMYVFPKKNKLHARNIKTAEIMLTKINMMAVDNPAMTFGLLRKLNPFVFEELLLLAFKQHDFKVKHNRRYTGDNGLDGIVFDEQGNKYLIQAKRYKSAINPAHVESFSHVVNQKQAHAGFFIHTGRTGKKSYQLRGQNISIISGHRLISLLTGKPFL